MLGIHYPGDMLGIHYPGDMLGMYTTWVCTPIPPWYVHPCTTLGIHRPALYHAAVLTVRADVP